MVITAKMKQFGIGISVFVVSLCVWMAATPYEFFLFFMSTLFMVYSGLFVLQRTIHYYGSHVASFFGKIFDWFSSDSEV